MNKQQQLADLQEACEYIKKFDMLPEHIEGNCGLITCEECPMDTEAHVCLWVRHMPMGMQFKDVLE